MENLMTLAETVAMHEKLGDDGFMDWFDEDGRNSDIESFKYLFKLRRKIGGLVCPPKIADKIAEWIEPKTVENTSTKDYEYLTKMINMGMEFFHEGIDIPEIGPKGLSYNPGPKVTKKKKRRKRGK